MLSVDYCKRYLANNKKCYSDKEIEEIRDSLYQIAEISVDRYLLRKINTNKYKVQKPLIFH